MARALCLLVIEGNVGGDPEMRYTASGRAVTQLSVAVSRPYKNKDDAWEEETTWYRVVCWGDTAERVAEKARKGVFVRVQGRIHTTEWEAPDCSKGKHYGWEVIADRVDILGKFESTGTGDFGRARTDAYVDQLGAGRPAAPVPSGGGVDDSDLDDLPF